MTFCYESRSADPCLWLMDPESDPDPVIFVIDLQDANKKLIKKKSFCAYYFLKLHSSFSKDKKSKRSQNSRNQGFSYYFCLMIEGSGFMRYLWFMDPDPGGPKTYGSDGSGSATLAIRYKKIEFLKKGHWSLPEMKCVAWSLMMWSSRSKIIADLILSHRNPP